MFIGGMKQKTFENILQLKTLEVLPCFSQCFPHLVHNEHECMLQSKSTSDNPSALLLCLKVRAGESLMKLVSDLKQFLILNDFPSVNEAISLQNQQLRSLQEECDKKLTSLRDEIAIDLYELEEEYYSSRYK